MHAMLEGDDLNDAIQRPRLHHQLIPMEVEYESDFDPVSIMQIYEGRSIYSRYRHVKVHKSFRSINIICFSTDTIFYRR